MPGDNVENPIWDEYIRIVAAEDDRGGAAIGHIECFAFYKEAKRPTQLLQPAKAHCMQM